MNITTVMVTFNRLELLKKAISSYERQSLLPETMIIIDNCSTDGTKKFLENWKSKGASFKKRVVYLPQNIGGSGGFHRGLQEALQTNAEWCWIADDDAFLDEHAFEKLEEFIRNHPKLAYGAAALCSSVVNDPVSNRIETGHRRRLHCKNGIPRQTLVPEKEYQKEYFSVDLFTYVGSMIRMDSLKKVGLPQKDLFIYYDDLEHSYRIGKQGPIYCIPSSKVYHSAAKHEEVYGTTWRSFYQSRNSLMFLKWHFPKAYKRIVYKRYLQKILLTPLRMYKNKNQMDFDAMKAAQKGQLGISEKYYIGWKLNDGQ